MTMSRFINIFALCLVTGIISLVGISAYSLKTLKIGSPAYDKISNGKDLVADILPPPLFVTEAYLMAVEAVAVPERLDADADRIKTLKQVFEDRRKAWTTLDIEDDARAQLVNGVEKSGDVFWATLDKSGILDKTKSADERKAGLTSLTKIYYDHRAEVTKLVEIANRGLDAAQADAEKQGNFWTLTSMVAGGLAIGLAILGAIFLRLRAIRPVLQLTTAMEALSTGHYEVDIPGTNRRDEFGRMSKSVAIFRDAGIENLRLQAEAEAMRASAEANRIAMQQKAEEDAAERLRHATAGLAAGLRALAAGNLSIQLTEAFSAEFEPLRADFNLSVLQLAETLAQVVETIETVDGEAQSIAGAAGDLSHRTETQAAALEQTAAALDEISVNVKNSAGLTTDAKHVAVEANKSALRSVEVVSSAEHAMQRIEQSSQQISNIIGVIDEIAFQTNLLALNAGVEAARAGEAGKGFAVVAQEVRELAQRSAQAAKEIKQLIQSSTREVDNGVHLVRETGLALQDIGTHIDQINRHMASMELAAREQSTGLTEINAAVNQMDQTTQRNAAMVEEQTASSASLASEVDRLRDLIGRFDLPRQIASGNRHAA